MIYIAHMTFTNVMITCSQDNKFYIIGVSGGDSIDAIMRNYYSKIYNKNKYLTYGTEPYHIHIKNVISESWLNNATPFTAHLDYHSNKIKKFFRKIVKKY